MKEKELKDFANSLKHGLFATKDSIPEYNEFAKSLIDTIDPTDRIAVTTILHVALNTVANEFLKILEKK
jgi:mannitol-1-phosphate/altronate dehydrogenase